MTRRMLLGALLVATLLLGYHIGRVWAAGIPPVNTMSYSGTLLTFGQPETGSHGIVLNLWVGSVMACQTTPASNIQFVNGRFSVPLDPSCVPVIHQNPTVNVEVLVDGTSMGQTPLGAVPYAVEADTASNPAAGSALGQLDPPGTVIAYAGQVGGASNVAAPSGWLFCNGATVSRTQYANLFGIVGTAYGSGDGATTFNLPDYRGFFLRGWDEQAGRDPDEQTRSAMASGGVTGNAVGTLEPGDFASHAHGVNDPGHSHGFYGGSPIGQHGSNPSNSSGFNSGGLYYPMGYIGGISSATTGISIANTGGSENRPINASVAYLIKY